MSGAAQHLHVMGTRAHIFSTSVPFGQATSPAALTETPSLPHTILMTDNGIVVASSAAQAREMLKQVLDAMEAATNTPGQFDDAEEPDKKQT